MSMEFIETCHFTRTISGMLQDEDYRLLQNELATNPETGDLVKGGGGIRKIRVRISGTGKRGGARVIYYWLVKSHKIYMLTAYAKAKKTDLDEDQKKAFRVLVKELEQYG